MYFNEICCKPQKGNFAVVTLIHFGGSSKGLKRKVSDKKKKVEIKEEYFATGDAELTSKADLLREEHPHHPQHW